VRGCSVRAGLKFVRDDPQEEPGVIAVSTGKVPRSNNPHLGVVNCRGRPIEGKCGHRRSRRRVADAADEKSAEAAAISEYNIGADMRRRLIVRADD
jgi:hypothetical protein